jgi:iron complex outermembrane recepter protein
MRFFSRVLIFILVGLGPLALSAQEIKGSIADETNNGLPLGFARIVVKGTSLGAYSDEAGAFSIPYTGALPVQLEITYTGYDTLTVTVRNLVQPLKLSMKEKTITIEVDIQADRVSKKQQESPLTVETLDLIAIRETPAPNFYEALGNLKGVDITAASMGFKVINTRGFNSTRPVRSLQIIDGVDNQAPGLNFSLGNFVGSSELDVQGVELIVGASSAQYGPGAFNGVIKMTTKSPFLHKGLSVMAKVGERDLFETALRYAKVFSTKSGREFLAFKFNASYFRAYDWVANDMSPTLQSRSDRSNPGGYDAVNRYGDEAAVDFQTNRINRFNRPGLGLFYRTGYNEKDLVDYNTYSLKLGAAMHWKIYKELEFIYSYNFGTGTTVYQGDNRYSLKGLQFHQHKIELRNDKFFVRFYYTGEDAGKSYDAVFTAVILQNNAKFNTANQPDWQRDYNRFWQQIINPQVTSYLGIPATSSGSPLAGAISIPGLDSLVAKLPSALLADWHKQARAFADGNGFTVGSKPRLDPGSPEFRTEFNRVISNPSFLRGGSRFVDESALWHAHGEYRFNPRDYKKDLGAAYNFNITVGANFRYYTPRSYGTIFADTLIDPNDESKGYRVITNWELGAYVAYEHKFLLEKLKLNAALRVDKNQNFNAVVSPAVSLVYTLKKNHTFRASFTSAIRNPTLQDQYLYYNLGTAILRGNLDGVNNVVTLASALDFLRNGLNPSFLKELTLRPVRPEIVRSIELGYKGVISKNVFIDLSYYYSWYNDFLGYQIVSTKPTLENNYLIRVSRYSANARDQVTTQGISVAVNYYFKKYFSLTGNYSWNKLDKGGSTDPIIPAFNTPEHKFNISIGGRDIKWTIIGKNGKAYKIHNWGFNFNFRWVQGFLFEGSPQFTGQVPTYTTLDGQLNYRNPKWKTIFKLGATNMLGVPFIQVYGGPAIGRLVYFSVQVDLD